MSLIQPKEGSRLQKIWRGHGHPDRPQKGGQVAGMGGTWLLIDGTWYVSPYRSGLEAVSRFELDEEAAVKEVLEYQKELSANGA